ncbi:Predicted nuclease of the RNAse H fold, HicB family [Mycobacterium numidiamassiliense]|uniref:Predicted nuclease of the RNAse H fold, HicB family n=1 Tax=Mycobacterium numidiamassiliense TaxID=1841861 RepID=A0A2U3P4G6_9MYCO|nr:Predicted nuclease of the RNAse H fold, HicB family [Mycobacterium numidiamassiliense]
MVGMPDRSRKRPRDLNSLAASIVNDATEQTPDRYTYRVEWSAEDNEWVGLCAELPSLSWLDPDKTKALAGIARLVQDVTAEKDPAAVALGRKGGLKGGRARAKKLTAEQRSEIARRAARSRWSTK